MSQNILSDRQLESWNSSARTHRGLSIFYLAALFFVLIIVEGTTHEQLLNPDIKIALPVLGSSIPVLSFYIYAPIFLILLHTQLLLQVAQLAESFFNFSKINPEKNEIEETDKKEDWRNTVLPTLLTTVLLKPPNIHPVTFLIMRFIAFISYWCLVPFVLVRLQLKFLPYHGANITLLHQVCLSLSLVLIAVFYYIIWKFTNQKKTDFKNYIIFFPIAFFWIVYLLSEITLPLSLVFVAIFYFLLREGIKLIKTGFKNSVIFLQFTLLGIVYMGITLLCWETLEIPKTNKECFPKVFGIVAMSFFDKPSEKKDCVNISNLIERNLNLPGKKLALRPEAEILDDFIHKDKHDKWLEFHETLDLTNRDLRFANFSGADLTKADFRGATLDNANLLNAKLEVSKWNPYKNPDGSINLTSAKRVFLILANLQGADIMGAKLQGAEIRGANLQGADMTYANLRGADFSKANLQGSKLKKANLQGAKMQSANLQGANIHEANLQGAGMSMASLQGADMREAKLQGAFMPRANLQGADMREAKLQGVFMPRANLQGVFMPRANLQGANIYEANLQGANMESANLQGANMESANLQGAEMIGAKLQGANLYSAKVNLTNFKYSNLGKLNFTEDELLKWAKEIPEQGTSIYGTRFPRKEFLARIRDGRSKETTLPDLTGDNYKFCHNDKKTFKGIQSLPEKECNAESIRILAELKEKWKAEKEKEKKK
jgi:uncharacterized protein YjbI with pentapeptide repeats